MNNSTIILNLKRLIAISDNADFNSFVFELNLNPARELEAKLITDEILSIDRDFFYDLYKKTGTYYR